MSEIKVNKISPKQTCTQLTLGDSGDTIIIPAGATITNNGTATGFGRTGTVNWDTTKKTSGFNAVNGVGYFCDTTGGAFTVTLPAAPSAGDIVAFSDYTGTWETNNITVGRNSSNINAAAADLILNANNTTATLIYVDATEGWRVIDTGSLSEVNVPLYVAATGGTITTCGDFKIHTFTGPSTFTVTSAGNSLGSTTVDYLVVAGGGGGAGRDVSGGGGSGGFRVSNSYGIPAPTMSPLSNPTGISVSVQGYPISVGGGGAGGICACSQGSDGSNSVFSTITSTGGGAGGYSNPGPANPGGSGGGSYRGTITNGLGNTPPTSPPQGNNGGIAGASIINCNGGGGGGGAGAVGFSGQTVGPGGGGIGSFVSPSFAVACAGTPGPAPGVRYFAGGGGGTQHRNQSPASPGPGGAGGGGAGAIPSGGNGNAGTTNTGGGGGASRGAPANGGAGGSGIVVIRYKFQ